MSILRINRQFIQIYWTSTGNLLVFQEIVSSLQSCIRKRSFETWLHFNQIVVSKKEKNTSKFQRKTPNKLAQLNQFE